MIQQHHLLNRVADWVDAGRIKTTMRQHLSPINAQNLRRAHAAGRYFQQWIRNRYPSQRLRG